MLKDSSAQDKQTSGPANQTTELPESPSEAEERQTKVTPRFKSQQALAHRHAGSRQGASSGTGELGNGGMETAANSLQTETVASPRSFLLD